MRWFFGILFVLSIFSVYMYVANPYGTSTWSPTARVMGFETYRISSTSMSATLEEGEFIYVNTTAYGKESPKTGDVLVFNYPKNRKIAYVFRVIGEAGDKVKIEKGIVYINDVPLDEPYVSSNLNPYSQVMKEITIGDQEFFVLGDNRDYANDSRFWGMVSRNDVIGKAVYIWRSPNIDRVGSIQ